MISLLQTSKKDKIKRSSYKQSELERRYYKLLKIHANNIGLAPIQTHPKIQIRNYCLITGRARSIYSRKFRISRHQIKKMFTFITNLRSSSW